MSEKASARSLKSGDELRASSQTKPPGRGHDDDRDDRHRREGHRDDAVGELLAAVLELHRPRERRDEHRVEDAAGREDVEHVGQGVGQGEGVTGQLAHR